MKNLLVFAIALSAVAWPLEERDEDCEIEWVTISPEATSLATTTSMANKGADEKVALPSASGTVVNAASVRNSPGTQGVVTTNSADEPGIPIDGSHLSAPASSAAVPSDAKIYTPPSKTISGKAFGTWMGEQASASPASKWLKVKPGVYNVDCSDNVVFSFMSGTTEKWTADLRGVTFLVAGTCQAIYINQCEDFTVLGGTIWFDAGEIWTQAKITSITDSGGGSSTATMVVDEGYNLTTWRSAGPRNLNAIDATDASHYVRPQGINFWYASNFNFDDLDSKRTWTMKIGNAQVPLKVGYHLTMETGISVGTTIASENNNNLHINGFTSNGGLAQYGLGSQGTATFEDVWYVNAPARPGFAPRVEGPTMSEGHIQWFDFNAGGQPKINYINSWWMTTGCEKDLQTASDQNLHDGGY